MISISLLFFYFFIICFPSRVANILSCAPKADWTRCTVTYVHAHLELLLPALVNKQMQTAWCFHGNMYHLSPQKLLQGFHPADTTEISGCCFNSDWRTSAEVWNESINIRQKLSPDRRLIPISFRCRTGSAGSVYLEVGSYGSGREGTKTEMTFWPEAAERKYSDTFMLHVNCFVILP